MKATVQKALNEQINNEMSASYAYLAMSNYFDGRDLPGFAAWFKAQSAEETMHAMKIHDYVLYRDGEVTLADIKAPQQVFQSAEDVVSSALKMEKTVTEQVQGIHAIATKESDVGVQTLMNWFVTEQEEEEDSFRTLLAKVRAAGENSWNLYQLDQEISAGAPQDAPAE